MPAYTKPLDPRVGKDGRRVFFVDESGTLKPGQQGNYYVIAGILTDSVKKLNSTIHSIQQKIYPERKELRSKEISHTTRRLCLNAIAKLDVEIIPHVVVKSGVIKKENLEDPMTFYKTSYNNLLKLIPDKEIHIVTDAYHTTEDQFNHFKNSINYVQDKLGLGPKILSVTPVKSESSHCVQAADVVAGSLRFYLLKKFKHCDQYPVLEPRLKIEDDCVFPNRYKGILRKLQCKE